MKELLEGLIAKFNEKAASDSGLQEDLQGVKKTVLIELQGGPTYHFTLENGRIDRLQDGTTAKPDVTIVTDADTLRALISREMGPFKAYATGKVKIKGSFDDLLRFRKFF
jgi:putative sterol carrier protein